VKVFTPIEVDNEVAPGASGKASAVTQPAPPGTVVAVAVSVAAPIVAVTR
jgi:hypothetical protein